VPVPEFNEPQPFAPLLQLTLQSAPAFELSLETFAMIPAVAVVSIEGGGAPFEFAAGKAIEMAAVGVTVRFVDADWLGTATDEAVIITLRLAASPEGAVYVAGASLAVCEVIVPQAPVEHDTCQFTPALVASPVTRAVTCVELPAARGDGGTPTILIETEVNISTDTVAV